MLSKLSLLLVFFLSAILAPSLCLAQSSTADVLTGTKNPNAVAVVERALGSMGGHSVIGQFSTAQVTGSLTSSGTGEQKTFVWKDQVSGNSYNFRKETHAANKTTIMVNEGGRAGIFSPANGRQKRLYSHVGVAGALPLHLPAIALSMALTSPEHSISFAETPTGGGPIHIRIKTEASAEKRAVSTQDWYFDPTSGLPMKVSFLLPSSTNALDTTQAQCNYTQFGTFSGMAIPTSFTVFEDGKQVAQISIAGVTMGIAVSASDFELPTEGK